MRFLPVAGAFASWLLWLSGARGAIATVEVGGRTLRIPAPVGFVRYDGRQESIDILQAGFQPEGNRLVAAFGEPGDLRNVRQGIFPGFGRVFSVQVNGQSEASGVTPEVFAQVQQAVHLQLARSHTGPQLTTMEGRTSTALLRNTSTRIQVKVSDAAPASIFAETPDATCFALLLKYKLSGDGLEYPVEDQSAVATCLLRLDGRLLYLHAAALYTEPADADWVRGQLVQWRDQIVAAHALGSNYAELPGSLADEAELAPTTSPPTNGEWRRLVATRQGKMVLAAMASALLLGMLSLLFGKRRRR